MMQTTLEGFLLEEWVGRRIRNAHILRILEPRNRHFLYNISEYVEGRSLGQWIQDNGPADLHQTRAPGGANHRRPEGAAPHGDVSSGSEAGQHPDR